MTDAAEVATRARTLSGLSRRQVALMASVAPSTVTRVEGGELDPTVSVFERILAACGYRWGGTLVQVVDLDAVRAARMVLDAADLIERTSAAARWVDLWGNAGLISSSGVKRAEIARRAGRLAPIARRPGAVKVTASLGAPADWRAVARALRERGIVDWAVTGAAAATRYSAVTDAPNPAVYVEDPGSTAERLGLHRVDQGRGVTLLPLDEVSAAGVVVNGDGSRWAADWQVVIDCFGGGGRAPDLAQAMLARLAGDVAAP